MAKFFIVSIVMLLWVNMFCAEEMDWDVSADMDIPFLGMEKYEKPRTAFIHEVMKAIHSKQHPPKEQCKKRRLLMLAYANNLEGVGSILRDIMLGLVSLIPNLKLLNLMFIFTGDCHAFE